ncbi:Rho GTPase-activating protein 6 [Homalodisca vitripennis]|nr:Rho GTPase-activating protein 6 [Homalodisca vitripennis]
MSYCDFDSDGISVEWNLSAMLPHCFWFLPPPTSFSLYKLGNCQWTNVAGRTITLGDTSLLHLSDIERRVLQKVALAKLQALNLGVAIRIPSGQSSAAQLGLTLHSDHILIMFNIQ